MDYLIHPLQSLILTISSIMLNSAMMPIVSNQHEKF